ncbi:MAG: hypothetical protein QNK69_03645 [Amylibacter sp.]
MKRIIYSIYTDDINPHSSAPDHKKSQFEKWKSEIESNQKEYAFLCGADYNLNTTCSTSYDEIQFEKILLLEKYAQEYDEILYLDFDVVAHTNVNYFEFHDMSKLTGHALDRTPRDYELKEILNFGLHNQNMFAKTCAKKAMLLLDNIVGNSLIVNTGVIGCNKNIAYELGFKDRLPQLHSLLDEAKNDNLYPFQISDGFFRNNEVYISFLIERYNIPFINIGMPWNFILDGYCGTPSSAAHLVHHVNKEFEISFENV